MILKLCTKGRFLLKLFIYLFKNDSEVDVPNMAHIFFSDLSHKKLTDIIEHLVDGTYSDFSDLTDE